MSHNTTPMPPAPTMPTTVAERTLDSNLYKEKATLMQLQKITGFKVSSNDQLKPIRQLELFKARNKLEADTTMSAADKTDKLADIDKQLAKLN